MPTTTLPDATVELLDYQQFLDYAADSLNYAGQTEMLNHVTQRLRSMPYNPSSSLTTKEQWAEQIMTELRANGYEIQYNGNNQWTGSVFPSTAQVSTTNPVNSNMVVVSRGKVRNWYGGLNEFDPNNMQFWKPQRMPVSGGLGSKAMYFLGSIGSGVAAASTGIWLGKTFDATLYNANPNFWDSIGWNTLNPETWGLLTNGGDSPFAGLWNFILGVDGEHGTAQAYMSEEMLAYLAYCMYKSGVFAIGGITFPEKPSSGNYTANSSISIRTLVMQAVASCAAYNPANVPLYDEIDYSALDTWIASQGDGFGLVSYDIPKSSNQFTLSISVYWYSTNLPYTNGVRTSLSFSKIGILWNYMSYNTSTPWSKFTGPFANSNESLYYSAAIGSREQDIGAYYRYQYGTVNATESTAIEGIGNQSGATIPDTTGWDDLSNVLPSLQQQYPDAFQNPMVWNTDTPYDDTAGNQTRYIPVPFPYADSATDTQPISGTQTQTNTSLNTTPQEILDLLTKTLQQTDTQPATPPINPVDTGTGSTPTPTAPTGNASALWSVYHPTQSQVDAFGAWLWGSPFLTNIGKLFQNPIDGVISLHKIFVTPVDSGTGTIVVGTLDSEVPSATVNQQYVYVDCGSVNCYESFGNVFDYSPHTQVSLYLPFIGIVPLDVNDVMRSSINVTYGVDVYTGACLAMVSVSRDGNTVNMYQYAGVASVEYPLSNVQNGQLVSGLLAIGAGVASIVATGGVSTPAVGAIVGGVAASSNSSVGKSGGFSGNSGAMGGKIPYLILQRPQTKVADNFVFLNGYPTNVSGKLSDFSGQVTVTHVHVEGIPATDKELIEIESLLKSGILI